MIPPGGRLRGALPEPGPACLPDEEKARSRERSLKKTPQHMIRSAG